MGMVGGSEKQHEAGGMGYGGDVAELVTDGGMDTD